MPQFTQYDLHSPQDADFLPDGGMLAFPCFHLYNNSVVFPKKADNAATPLAPHQIAGLKGKDGAIGRAVQRCLQTTGGGLDLFLQPYLTHEYTREYDTGDYLLQRYPTGKRVPRKMSDNDIERHFNAEAEELYYGVTFFFAGRARY